MAASTVSCANCGKQGVGFQCCSVCKKASYCGAECQKAGWKRHKKTCAPPLPVSDVMARVRAADAAGDWREVLRWEGRLAEVMATATLATCLVVLKPFRQAHDLASSATGSTHHALSAVRLREQRVEILGKMERFRDQGEAICIVATDLVAAGKDEEARVLYERARNIGAAHGFFSVECRACHGLGALARSEGRAEEGLDLMRNALAAVNPPTLNPKPSTLNPQP